MWVHGHAVTEGGPPDADTAAGAPLLRQYRQGWATRFTLERPAPDGSRSAWLQVAIPTPARLDDVRMALDRLTILFRTKDQGTGLAGIDLWSGPQIVDWTFPARPAPIWGDYRRPRKDNSWTPRTSDGPNRRVLVEYGLGVSLNVVFGGERSWFEICAAGAEFVAETAVTG